MFTFSYQQFDEDWFREKRRVFLDYEYVPEGAGEDIEDEEGGADVEVAPSDKELAFDAWQTKMFDAQEDVNSVMEGMYETYSGVDTDLLDMYYYGDLQTTYDALGDAYADEIDAAAVEAEREVARIEQDLQFELHLAKDEVEEAYGLMSEDFAALLEEMGNPKGPYALLTDLDRDEMFEPKIFQHIDTMGASLGEGTEDISLEDKKRALRKSREDYMDTLSKMKDTVDYHRDFLNDGITQLYKYYTEALTSMEDNWEQSWVDQPIKDEFQAIADLTETYSARPDFELRDVYTEITDRDAAAHEQLEEATTLHTELLDKVDVHSKDRDATYEMLEEAGRYGQWLTPEQRTEFQEKITGEPLRPLLRSMNNFTSNADLDSRLTEFNEKYTTIIQEIQAAVDVAKVDVTHSVTRGDTVYKIMRDTFNANAAVKTHVADFYGIENGENMDDAALAGAVLRSNEYLKSMHWIYIGNVIKFDKDGEIRVEAGAKNNKAPGIAPEDQVEGLVEEEAQEEPAAPAASDDAVVDAVDTDALSALHGNPEVGGPPDSDADTVAPNQPEVLTSLDTMDISRDYGDQREATYKYADSLKKILQGNELVLDAYHRAQDQTVVVKMKNGNHFAIKVAVDGSMEGDRYKPTNLTLNVTYCPDLATPAAFSPKTTDQQSVSSHEHAISDNPLDDVQPAFNAVFSSLQLEPSTLVADADK